MTGAGMVGRDVESGVLVEHLAAAQDGRGSVVLVEGEAGIGKTSLVDALVRVARDAGVTAWVGRADELERRRPFALVASAAGAVRGSQQASAEALDVLAPYGGRELDLVDTYTALVEDRAARGPLVVVLEDLHWADPASLLVVRRLSRTVGQRPLLLVGTTRPTPRSGDLHRCLDDLTSSGATRVGLGPLPDECLPVIVRGLTGDEPDAPLREVLSGWGGNPLLLTEAVGVLREEDGLDAEVLSSVHRAITRRLGHLADDTLEVLRRATLLGPSFAMGDVVRLTGRPATELAGPLEEAVGAQVLVVDGTSMAFRHDLIRAALHDDVPEPVQAALHLDLARSLSADGAEPVDVAAHLLAGARPGDLDAVGLLHDTARRVAAVAPSVATDLLQRGLELSGPSYPARRAMTADLAAATTWSGRVADGCAVYLELIEAGGHEPGAEARLRLGLAYSLLHQGRAAECRDQCRAALERGDADPVIRARLSAQAAFAEVFLGMLGEARADAVAARTLALAADDPIAEITAELALGFVANLRGDLTDALAHGARAAHLADACGRDDAHRQIPHVVDGMFLFDADRFADGHAAVRRGRLANDRVGTAGAVPQLHTTDAIGSFMAGEYDDALSEIETGLAVADELGSGWQAEFLSLRGLIGLRRGDVATASEQLRLAGEVEGAAYRPAWLPWLQALLLDASGRTEQALAVLGGIWDGLAGARVLTDLPAVGPDLVDLAVRAGDSRRAADVVDVVAAIAAANLDVPSLEACALRCAGLATGDADLLRRAASAYTGSPRRYETARAHEDAAIALLRAGRDGAGPLLDVALELYVDLGCSRDAARARAAAREFGLDRTSRGPRSRPRTGWDSLTQSERRVAFLLVERLSNAEIGEQLFVSPRTVQTHVSNALAKLQLTSRLELAREAARRTG